MNETIILTYENFTAITLHPVFIIMALVVWFVPLILYVIVGSVVKAKSPSGQVLSKTMICYPNFWYAFFIYFLLQPALFLMLIFPFWLKWMG